MRSAVAYVIEALERRLFLASSATLVSDILPGDRGSDPGNLTNFNGRVFFTAYRPDVGMELGKSDGTESEVPAVGQPLPEKPSGTSLVKDINPGAGDSNPSYLTELVLRYGGNKVKDILFFTANDGQHGTDLWMTDGTRAGTQMVPGQPNNLNPGNLTAVSETGTLYFSADDGINGRELWKTATAADGSVSVVRVKDLFPGRNPSNITDVNGIIFFAATTPRYGVELFRSDGTSDGTPDIPVKDIWAGRDSSDPQYLTNVNGTLFFSAYDPDHGRELWKSDGTEAGTELVRDIYGGPESSVPTNLTNVAGTLYFSAYQPDTGVQLWKSDGTEAGTTMIPRADGLDSHPSFYPQQLTDVHGTLYFSGFDEEAGRELWRTVTAADGSVGVERVKDLFPGTDSYGFPNSSYPAYLQACGDSLYFAAYHASDQLTAVWKAFKKADGSVDVELVGGPNYSGAGGLTVVDGTVYFMGSDASHGAELWKVAPPQPKPDPKTGETPPVLGPTIAQANSPPPPDPNGAVGPEYLLSVVNQAIQWSSKDGKQQQTMSLYDFFGPKLKPKPNLGINIFDNSDHSRYNTGMNSKHNGQPRSLMEAVVFFSDLENARLTFEKMRWPNGVSCPRCGSTAVKYSPKYRRWQCSASHPLRQFTVKVGTVMEDSPLGLDKWAVAFWLEVNAKNSISSYEIHRALKITQKSAWFMLHRIRLAVQRGSMLKMGGNGSQGVEVDESYIGGLARNMHKSRRDKVITGTGGINKTAVMGLLERHSEKKISQVRTKVIDDTRRETLHAVIHKHVEPGSQVYTDKWVGYAGLDAKFVHDVIDHAQSYVNGKIHVNGLENFWSLFKRCIKGTHVSVEPFHLFRYLDSECFRFNNRDVKDGDRFVRAIQGIEGKRLTYKALTGASEVAPGSDKGAANDGSLPSGPADGILGA